MLIAVARFAQNTGDAACTLDGLILIGAFAAAVTVALMEALTRWQDADEAVTPHQDAEAIEAQSAPIALATDCRPAPPRHPITALHRMAARMSRGLKGATRLEAAYQSQARALEFLAAPFILCGMRGMKAFFMA